ncbi:MAG: SRPBCC domain-containing protein [Pseudomonadota bacterium]
MNPTYAVYTHIDRPVEQVFQAVVDHRTFTKAFFAASSGDLVEGTTVAWDNGAWVCDVHVDRVVANERIEITFNPTDFAVPELREGDKRDYQAKIVFMFEPADVGGTLVTLCEYGWGDDKRSILQSYGHCSGWQEMLMCLKALLVFGVDLSSPRDARPDYAKLWVD